MEFSYVPIPQKNTKGEIGERCFPFIPIRLIYNHRVGRPIHALLDSGSERNLFPASYGELVGIPVKRGNRIDILGIGGVTIPGYTWEVKLYLQNTGFLTKIDFSYEQQVPLLGRNGFFNHFSEVVFKEKERIVVLQ